MQALPGSTIGELCPKNGTAKVVLFFGNKKLKINQMSQTF